MNFKILPNFLIGLLILSSLSQMLTIIEESKDEEFILMDTHNAVPVSGRYSPGSSHIDSVEDILVLAVEFSDERFSTSTASIANQLFYSGNSMANYFDEVTYGTVDVTGDVIGPMRLSNSIYFYDNSNTDHGDVKEAVRDAIDLFDSSVDFSKYDDDGDGVVDNFMIVFAGESDSSNGDSNGDGEVYDPGAFWPHRWSIGTKMTNDGVAVDDYFICTEQCPIGTYAHELVHNFGLPDLYDYDRSSAGVGYWALMGSGNHLKTSSGSSNPAHMNAWTKIELGLLEPTVINPSIDNSYYIDALSITPEALKVEITDDEYFLIEYRSNDAESYYDSALPSSGVLIWHIDESKCIGVHGVNVDEDHPCVRLVQADGDKDLEHNRNRGDSGDPFVVGDLFNVNSYPAAIGYYGDDPGIQMTVTAMYDDFAKIHFGSFSAWFYDIYAETNDDNGDGFKNEITFTYDPDTNGASQDIVVHFDFYTQDRDSFVTTFEYDHTIQGNDIDEFETSIGYYNGHANGMWWVEARLEIGESISDEHVFGNIWIEYPSSGNHFDDYWDVTQFVPKDTDSDGGNETLEIYVDWDSLGTSNQADYQLILTNPDYPSQKSFHTFNNRDGSSEYLEIDMRETSLRPGLVDATLELYVDGDREDMITELSLDLDWETIVFTRAHAEGMDVDGDGEYDSLNITWQIDHSFRENTAFTFEVTAWAYDEETEWFDPFPSMRQSYNQLLGPMSEGFTGGRDLTNTILQSDEECVVSIEIRAISKVDGTEYTHWVELDNTSSENGIELYPIDWRIITKDAELTSRDDSDDGNEDTLVISYDMDTNANHMQIGAEFIITSPDSETYTLWDNFTISGDEFDLRTTEFTTWMEGLHHVQATFWDLDEGAVDLTVDFGTIYLKSAFDEPSVYFELPDEGWLGMPCMVSVVIEDMASHLLDATTTVEWGYAPVNVPDDVLSVDCSAWTANNHILSVTYESSIGVRVSESVNFEMKSPPSLQVSFSDEIYSSNAGETCEIEPTTAGVDARTVSSWSISNALGEEMLSTGNQPGVSKVDCSSMGAGVFTIEYNLSHPSGVSKTAKTGLYVVSEGEVTRVTAGEVKLAPKGLIFFAGFSLVAILGGLVLGRSLGGPGDGDWDPEVGMDMFFDEPHGKQAVSLPGDGLPVQLPEPAPPLEPSTPQPVMGAPSAPPSRNAMPEPEPWEADGYHWREWQDGTLEYWNDYSQQWEVYEQ